MRLRAVRDTQYAMPVKASASARGDRLHSSLFLSLTPRGLDSAWRQGRRRTAPHASASNMVWLLVGRIERHAGGYYRPGNLQ